MEARIKWTGDMQFVARTGNGPAIVMDTIESGSGPSPMEMVLMGVAGCTAMDVISIMQKKRARLNDFQIRITGERAEGHPKKFTRIHIEYILRGRGVKPKDVERAISLSETKYCSAMASLNADFDHDYRIEEAEA